MAKVECSFEPCDRNAYCKNLCQGHYNQQYKGKVLTPFAKTRIDYNADSAKQLPVCAFQNCDIRIPRKGSSCGEHKRCLTCLETKSITEFFQANEYKANCKLCYTPRLTYTRHHMTTEQYETMLENQNGLCANPSCYEKPTVIDHDHSCCPGKMSCGKCVRGLLCNFCNSAEGYLRSNANLALGLAEYMIMTSKTTSGIES